jgi:hypothetical protein
MLARTQVSLDPELQRRARRRAAELGVSFAEYVRRLVVRDIEKPAPRRERAYIFGLGASGGADVARDKDRMVAEAIAARRARRRR